MNHQINFIKEECREREQIVSRLEEEEEYEYDDNRNYDDNEGIVEEDDEENWSDAEVTRDTYSKSAFLSLMHI